MKKPLIICITGMPGAGKTTVASGLGSRGFYVISMGDVVREELRRRGLAPVREKQLELMRSIRKELGPDAVARLSGRKIASSRRPVVVVDGVRSPEEVEYFKELGEVRVLAVHASPSRRYSYLSSRGRSDDPRSWEEFRERDLAELALRIGDVIALADGVVVNEGLSKEELQDRTLEVIEGWVREFEERASESACEALG